MDYWGFDINVEGNITKDFKLTAHYAKSFLVREMGRELIWRENIFQHWMIGQKKLP